MSGGITEPASEEMDWRAEARRKVAIGLEQLLAGPVVDGEQAVEEILDDLRRRHTRDMTAS